MFRTFLVMLGKMHSSRDDTVEYHIVLTTVAFFSLIIFSAYSLYQGQTFNANDFGEAVGVILGGSGLAAVGQGIARKTCSKGDEDVV